MVVRHCKGWMIGRVFGRVPSIWLIIISEKKILMGVLLSLCLKKTLRGRYSLACALLKAWSKRDFYGLDIGAPPKRPGLVDSDKSPLPFLFGKHGLGGGCKLFEAGAKQITQKLFKRWLAQIENVNSRGWLFWQPPIGHLKILGVFADPTGSFLPPSPFDLGS